MDILRPIDYVWSVGESHHQREKGPGDGASLLMWGWYLDAMLPLEVSPVNWMPVGRSTG